ncbi:MAG: hypothetical protein QXV85_09960 [Candidatus Bathyarchaeia archaeon]
MSHETLVVGTIYFRDKLTGDEVDKLKNFVSSVLEVPLEKIVFDDSGMVPLMEFEHVNWTSHVDESRVEAFSKYVSFFPKTREVYVSLYYLTQADFSVYVEDSRNVIDNHVSFPNLLREDDIGFGESFLETFPELKPAVIASDLSTGKSSSL